MIKVTTLIAGLVASLTASVLLAAELTVQPPLDTVAKVAAVMTRDSGGRAHRFTDAGNREFAVTYDDQQRVRSVEATRGPHINDIVSVGYGADGKMAAVTFRTGYALFFDHRPNGTEVIRDSRGGSVIRSRSAIQPIDSAAAEESVKLAVVLTSLESLMGSLGQSAR